jgi:purine nucleoside phosphorylase
MTLVIFGGTAAYHLKLSEHAEVGERRIIDTPFGPSAPFVHLKTAAGAEAWFSSRHGEDGLQRSAAFVNHKANIWAARELGADGILSWNGVGAIAPGLTVGQAVIPDDVLDMTRGRDSTFGKVPIPPPPPHPIRTLRRRIEEGEQNDGWAHTYQPEVWKVTQPLAREMRLEPTPAEERLWKALRGKQLAGYKFRRQHPIDRFIVDFYCAQAKLVIEVEGEIHQQTQEEDALRSEILRSKGLRVIRFTNKSVFEQFDTVLHTIRTALDNPDWTPESGLSPSPLRWGGGRGVGTSSVQQQSIPQGLRRGRGVGTPFSPALRARLIAACAAQSVVTATHGTYVCTEGPRLETAAEIAMFGWGGAAVVGMTLCPEVWLAAELGIPYASLCIITNMATGRWHLDSRRDFGPGVGVKGLHITLAACVEAAL